MTSTESKPLAVVTGASSGIGRELGKQLAKNGFDLLVNAEDDRLDAAAAEMRGYGARVRAVRADLRTAEGVEKVYTAVTAIGRPVDVAALNAGVGQGGAFLDNDLADEIDIIDLNITSTVRLAKRILRDMAVRDEGKVLITSSIAATVPGSFQAVYNASKSFLQSFGEAVQNELRDTGITITVLMPGPTETDFFRRAAMQGTKVGASSKDDPALVAEQGLRALVRGDAKLMAGSLGMKAQGIAAALLPDRLKAAAHRQMAEPGPSSR
jgi:short-subunit dehydrogenase